MITKSQLLSMDLSSLRTVQSELRQSQSNNQARRSGVNEARGHVQAGWQGDTSQQPIARLQRLDQRITDHINDIISVDQAIDTYCSNKENLQRTVISYLELIASERFFMVTEDWHVIVSPVVGLMGGPNLGPNAARHQNNLQVYVEAFMDYDHQAPSATCSQPGGASALASSICEAAEGPGIPGTTEKRKTKTHSELSRSPKVPQRPARGDFSPITSTDFPAENSG